MAYFQWKGWDIEGEIHVQMSKRHLFEGGSHVAMCGATPKSRRITPSVGEGNEPCKRCMRIEDKMEEKHESNITGRN